MRPFDSTDSTNDDPMQVFQEWLKDAAASEPNDPTAAAFATATSSGTPSVRMVLTKGADERGVRLFTNSDSQKGRELRENPQAALCFHWKSLRRQVRFAGSVETLGRVETEAYFHSRSRVSQIAASVSAQSRPLASRADLDAAVGAMAAQLGSAIVPLPEFWSGFLLVPRAIEFWSDGEDRLHDRMRFTREAQIWISQRLYP
jgi:pyridoxamine 5'-phosphate oxidase